MSVNEVLKMHHNQIQCDVRKKGKMEQFINVRVQENTQQKDVFNTITQEGKKWNCPEQTMNKDKKCLMQQSEQ